MLVGLICHFFSPVTHSMSVDLFQHFIRTPSTIRHDVGIWDTECVPDRSGVVPLRYNYDKPEKPRRIKGFEVFSLVFSSFSKPKNHTEISRIIGGVSLTTNE